jgi:TctA family transporter
LVFGVAGAILVALDFPIAPILLGFVLGPLVEENFRRTLLLSHGNMMVFLQRPISATFIAASALLVIIQLFLWFLKIYKKRRNSVLGLEVAVEL